MGSPTIAGLISHLVFWGLLVYGFALGELSQTRIAAFLLLWLAGLIGLPYVAYEPVRAMFSSFVAVVDVVLVFMIFKGDVRSS
jgi:hypothetical protein